MIRINLIFFIILSSTNTVFGQLNHPEYIITPHTVESGTYQDTIPYEIFEYLTTSVTHDILQYRMQVNPYLEGEDVYYEGHVVTTKSAYKVLFDPPLDPAYVFDFTIYRRRSGNGLIYPNQYILEKNTNAPLRSIFNPSEQLTINTLDDLYPNSNRFVVFYDPEIDGYQGYARISGDFKLDQCCGLWKSSTFGNPNDYIGAASLITDRMLKFTNRWGEVPLGIDLNQNDTTIVSGHNYSDTHYYYKYKKLDSFDHAVIVRMPKPSSKEDRHHHKYFELIYYSNDPEIVGMDFDIRERYEIKYIIDSGSLPYFQNPKANYQALVQPQIRKLSEEEVAELKATLPYFPQFIKFR